MSRPSIVLSAASAALYFLVLPGVLRAEEAPTLAERLGYAKDAKLLIVNADDSGMCHSANMATFKAMKEGFVTSTTAMVPCPWFPEFAKIAREHPDLDVGLHLCLTSEWAYYRWRPVTPVSLVPGLVDAEGFLWRDISSYTAHATPAEIETELRAQIERALFFGITPSHVDCHMGCYEYNREAWKIMVRIAGEYNLPMRSAVKIRSAMLARDGFAVQDSFFMPNAPAEYEARFQVYADHVRRLRPGVHEIGIHLALDDDEIKHITNGWRWRVGDFRVFTDPRMGQVIKEAGVQLIGWRDLFKAQQQMRTGSRPLKPTNLPAMSKERVDGYWESVWDFALREFQETEGALAVPGPQHYDHAARTMGYPDAAAFETHAQTWNGDYWREAEKQWRARLEKDVAGERRAQAARRGAAAPPAPAPAAPVPVAPPAGEGDEY